jgi:hypothetical protein
MAKTYSIIFIASLMLNSGCMNTRLVANYSSDNIQPYQTTKINLFWGLVQPTDIPAECESNTICNVTTQTNLGFILLSAVTIGAVVPQKIIWNCCPSNEQEEILR